MRIVCVSSVLPFFFNVTAPTEIYTLSLHDALPIYLERRMRAARRVVELGRAARSSAGDQADRKSTRLNSSHRTISYAVFCLKKKKKTMNIIRRNDIYIKSELTTDHSSFSNTQIVIV